MERALFEQMRWYLFLGRSRRLYVGHNPLAQVGDVRDVHAGHGLHDLHRLRALRRGPGHGELGLPVLLGWVIPLFGYSQAVHTWHHLCAWYLFWFTIVHLYMVIREDIISGLTVVSSMISGWRDRKN